MLDTEDMPRHQPPLPIVTTSGPSVTQHQLFSHIPSTQRPPAERPGHLGGKTVTVKAVCRSDIQAQKGGAGTPYSHFLYFLPTYYCKKILKVVFPNSRFMGCLRARWPNSGFLTEIYLEEEQNCPLVMQMSAKRSKFAILYLRS